MDFTQLLVEPVEAMLMRVGVFLPKLIVAIVLLIAGLTLAKILESLVARALKFIQIDTLMEKIKVSDFLMRGGITMTFAELVGAFVYWIVLLLTATVTLNTLQLTGAAELFDRLIAYIPHVIAGIFVLGVGIFFASFLSVAVRTAASNAGLSSANFLGQVVQIVILIFTGLTALEQLRFHILLLQQTLLIFIASIGFGFAIALGLGTKDLVGDMVGDMIDRMRSGRKH